MIYTKRMIPVGRSGSALRVERRGSALLVALLVMGLLMTLTLGISALVISEIRQTGDIVQAGKAYYAAEAGVENALLDLREHLPGYQTTGEEGWVSGPETGGDASGAVFSDGSGGPASDSGGASDLSYRYRIRNQGDMFPYFDDDKLIYLTAGIGSAKSYVYSDKPEKTYNVLPLNQTVTIPLFVDCGDGTISNATDFTLQYYVNFDEDLDPNPLAKVKSGSLKDLDILRWKIFGESKEPVEASRTFTISDFYPAIAGDDASNPVCIGSTQIAGGENISCKLPVLSGYTAGIGSDVVDANNTSDGWSVARQCYTSEAGSIVAPADDSGNAVQKNCSIKTFMESHQKNYLTLTNIVNPELIGITDAVRFADSANIYYRILAKSSAGGGESGQEGACSSSAGQGGAGGGSVGNSVLPREAAQISADGYGEGGRLKQSIDVSFKQNSFLPVFNFSMFVTSQGNPQNYARE